MDGSAAPRLVDLCLPVLVEASRRALQHSDAEGRLVFDPARGFDYLQDMSGIACLAAAYLIEHPANPLRGDARLGDLIRRAGRFMARHHLDPATNPPGHMWYEGREVHEWAFEMWLTAWRALTERGAGELAAGWKEGLRAGAEPFYRWCREIEQVRTASSPNLLVSPNHFAFFILDALEAGLALDLPEYREAGLERARWLAAQQKPDGYWEETDGPTTSYNFITTAAVGWYYQLTGEQAFLEALRRALLFHARFSYPDGCFLETIDQRVRYRPYPGSGWVWVLQAFSNFAEGRGLVEAAAERAEWFRPLVGNGHSMGRLAKALLYYRDGPAAPAPAALERGAWTLDGPAGVLKDGTWTVGLCGIPSLPRPHRYTLDRQNLLSVWHREAGLVIGGGNSRNHPQAATFHKRIALDPQATVDGVLEQDAYLPVRAGLHLTGRSGALTLGYWGFDAELSVEVLDRRRLRIAAAAWGRKRLMPVLFSPNVRLRPGRPIRTASGREVAVDGSPFELSADEMGGWFGQDAWRITAPPGATLSYPFRPYYPDRDPEELEPDLFYGILTVPVVCEGVTLEVTVGGGG